MCSTSWQTSYSFSQISRRILKSLRTRLQTCFAWSGDTPRIITSVRSFGPACAKDLRRLAQQLGSHHASPPGKCLSRSGNADVQCRADMKRNDAPTICRAVTQNRADDARYRRKSRSTPFPSPPAQTTNRALALSHVEPLSRYCPQNARLRYQQACGHRLPASRSPSKPTGCCSPTDARLPDHGGLLQERLVALAGHALQGWPVKDVDDASGVIDSPSTLDFACNF